MKKKILVLRKIIFFSLLFFISFSSFSQIPTDQDCLGAIAVCTDYYYQENSYSGTGNYPDEINSGPSCMDSGEKNDVWYIITVQSNGMMGFLITPNNLNDDYDWAVYNLTDAECEDIYFDPSLEVSCNWSGTKGQTGPNGGSNMHHQGAGGTPFNAMITVSEGQTYVINISNYSSTQYGYELDFSLSSALIFDDVEPFINYTQESIGCAGETELYIEFSENVLCNSVQATDFTLTGPASETYSVTDVMGESCELGGMMEFAYTLTVDPPIFDGGEYIVQVVGQITDLCENNALSLPVHFVLEAGVPVVDFDGLYPFNCINDDPFLLTGNNDGGEFWADCGSCIDDHGDGTATFDPTQAGIGQKNVTYTYMDGGGCADTITRITTIRSLPVEYTVAGGGEFCEGSTGPDIYLAENTSEAFVNYELYRNGQSTGQIVVGTGIGGINFGPQYQSGDYTIKASGNCGVSNMIGSVEIFMGVIPERFQTSGGGNYCADINGIAIQLNDSEVDVEYELLLNGVLTGVSLTGTGNSLVFDNQTDAGWYRIFADNGSCQDTMNGAVQVGIYPVPVTDAGDDLSIPYGTYTTLSGSATGGTGDYSYLWDPAASLVDPNISNPQTTNLEATTVFNLNVTDDNGCDNDDEMTVTVTGGPLGVVVTASPEIICDGESSQLNAIASGGSGDYTFAWTSSPGSFTSTLPDPVVNPSVTTQYNVEIYDGFNTSNGSTTVTVNPLPGAVASADQVSIPYGSTTVLHVVANGSTGPHTYSWEPSSLVDNPSNANPNTLNLEITTTFIVNVVDDITTCGDQDEIEIEVYGGPLQIVSVSADPDEMCNNGESVQLNAQVFGGTENYDYSWSSNPAGFTADIVNPVVYPTENTTYILSVDDGNVIVTNEINVVVHELPVAEAGNDQTINYGTATQLDGSASGGSGSYTWSWTPANQLIDPNVAKPLTQILEEPVVFQLTTTDFYGCQGDDDVVINITGGPLGVVAHASTDEFCQNEMSTLYALPHGGSEIYYYKWKNAQNEEISSDTTAVVMPMETTYYIIEIFDGFTYSEDTIWLQVNPLPTINIVPEGYIAFGDTIIACVFDTIILNAGNPGFNFEWSNHSPEQTFQVSTTGIGYDVQKHWVKVTNPETGCIDTATITIIFSFEECTGVDDLSKVTKIDLYPNPTNGKFNLVINDLYEELNLQIMNLQGQIVYTSKIQSANGFEKIVSLDISKHPEGIYLIKLYNDKFFNVRKVIRN